MSISNSVSNIRINSINVSFKFYVYEKKSLQARAWAAEHGFRKVATKKDSIGVCFCPMDYRTFLKNWLAQNNEALADCLLYTSL